MTAGAKSFSLKFPEIAWEPDFEEPYSERRT